MGERPAVVAAGAEQAKTGESIFFHKGQKSITNRRAEMSFVGNIEEIRSRAQRKIDQGPVTEDYKLDLARSVSILKRGARQ
jgi:hypothetical protein